MTIVLGLLGFTLFAGFGLIVLFGAPYVPTFNKQVTAALDLLDLQPGDTMLELGCGDGKVLLAAAARGWKVVGYELNLILVIVCLVRTRRYRQLVRVRWGNFLTQQWPPAQGIFIFGLQSTLKKVDKKIMQSKNSSVKLVSFAYETPGRTIAQTRDGVHLYLYK